MAEAEVKAEPIAERSSLAPGPRRLGWIVRKHRDLLGESDAPRAHEARLLNWKTKPILSCRSRLTFFPERPATQCVDGRVAFAVGGRGRLQRW
jgi:hypothetical protein